ncbi:hypothetical protein CVD28_18890 [Bacillus sp. M6-12]|uniref:hypothetical protein n=1 Tax=Bacillus sp. M6-12 TaxID=2054166 RepID=UPI000C7695C0|nr:hypothetical protein [Bacillus sp. M6-12]PLS16108.1 hypothetical protein CVD28_18890 [Bacillus sp. M6-12]
MKKMLCLFIVAFAFMLTGCSIEIDTGFSDSKSEKIVSAAEALQDKVNEALDTLEKLENQNKITADDQERVAGQLANVISAINDFKKVEAPFLGNKIKDLAFEKFQEKEETLVKVQEKAEQGEASKKDLEQVKDALSDDFSFNLFKK